MPVAASGAKKLNHPTLPSILALLWQIPKLLSRSYKYHCLLWNTHMQNSVVELSYSVMVYLYK